MKLRLTILLLLICASYSTAQLVIVTPETQEITIAWEAGTDSLGFVDSDLRFFSIYYWNYWAPIIHDSTAIYVNTVGSDTLECDIFLPDTNGSYIPGVSAIDIHGNESAIHKSTDPTASLGGWYLLFDRIAPFLPTSLIRIK